MYLSRVWLDPTRRGARRLLSSPQRMHAVIAAATTPPGETSRPLWRTDDAPSGLQLLVVSDREPDFTSLLEQSDVPTEDGWQTTSYEPFLGKLAEGQVWQFRLTANPTRNVREVTDPANLPRGKRVPVVGNRNLQDWLLKKSVALGAEIDEGSFVVSGRRSDDFRKAQPADGESRVHRVVISAVQFDGKLRVADADALRAVLTEGIGSAKAYGCGLMTLAAVR